MKKTLTMLLATIVALVAGCRSTTTITNPDGTVTDTRYTPAYVEKKAYRISSLVCTKLLADKPDRRDAMEQALADLKTLEADDRITLTDVIEITTRIPKDMSSDAAFYTSAGILIFEDDLETIYIQQPELMRPVVTGLRRGVEEALK